MSRRAYMLLDIVDRRCEYAVRILRNRAEVTLADRLEGYPNMIAIVEAADRQSLAKATISVLGCIDGITEGLRLLVTQDGEISPDPGASGNSTPRARRVTRSSTGRERTNSGRR
jgi:hypothetical protein